MPLPMAGRRWPGALLAAAAATGAWTGGTQSAMAGTATVACPAGAAASSFTDVPSDDVHVADVGCAAFRGIAEGSSPTAFAPSATVTREQLATFVARLVRSAGATLPAPSGAGFDDVPATSVHAGDVTSLDAAGIVRGVAPGRFEPAGLVTRNQLASFLVRAYDYVTGSTWPTTSATFPDVAGDAHATDIAAAAAAGFVSGYPDGTYRPTGLVSREQMASSLVRVLDRAVTVGHFAAHVPDQPTVPSGPGPCPSDPAPAAVAAGRATGPGRADVITVPDPTAPGGARSVWVYRPAVPDSRSLPVVYFLHGGLPSGWQALPEHGMAQALDALFTSGQAAPFVLAAPDGNTVGIADPEWANSTDGRDREESFITGPLIEAVEGNHLRDRAHRAITGLSMGGYGAANVALHHPGLYGQVAALQGYYDLDDASNIFTTGYDEWWNSPDQHADAAAGQRWLVGDATGDSEPGIVGEACRMLSVLAAHGEHARAYFAPGTHGWAWLMDNLPAVARFLTGGWPAPAA